jgi:hypothetical protein
MVTESINGSCVCGLVSFRVSEPFDSFYFCHCSRCRRSTGSAHAANIFARLDRIDWLSGKDQIKNFELPEAEFFNKSFCSKCGSPVPHKARSGNFLIIPAGSLDSAPSLSPQNNIFWDDRADWYDDGCNSEKISGYRE